MLVLSRKLGQSFHLGPDVRVTIVKIDRNSVRIGIEAPDDVPIQREEIVFELPESYRDQDRGRLKRAWRCGRTGRSRVAPLGLILGSIEYA